MKKDIENLLRLLEAIGNKFTILDRTSNSYCWPCGIRRVLHYIEQNILRTLQKTDVEIKVGKVSPRVCQNSLGKYYDLATR